MDAKPLKIFIIEDDPFQYQFVAAMLKDAMTEEYELLWADRLSRCLELLGTNRADIMLLDLMLPDSTDINTFIHVQKNARDIPIIIMSGLEDADFAKNAVQLGAQDYLVKGKIDGHSMVRAIYYAVERKKTEVALKESEKRFRRLFEQSNDAIFIHNFEGKIFDVNNRACEMLGYEKNALLRMSLSELHPEEALIKATEALQTIQEKGSARFESKGKKADHSIIDIEISANIIDKSNGIIQGIVHDITKRKQAEEKLLLFHKFAEASRQGLGWTDLDGNIRYANHAFCRMIEESRSEELYHKSIIQYYDVATQQRLAHEILPILLEKGQWTGELKLIGAQGSKLSTLHNLFNINDHNGNPLYFANVVTDITDRKRAEEKLKKKENLLRKANRKLVESFKKLRQTHASMIQQEKLASIGQLAAGVAHELNNPLGFVMNNFVTLKKYLHKIDEYFTGFNQFVAELKTNNIASLQDDLEKFAQMKKSSKIDFIFEDIRALIEESSTGFERIMSIVQSLRNFSRVDFDGEMQLHDLNQAIEETLVVARNEIKYVAEVEQNFSDIPQVECKGGEINQVLLNILVNAAQAIGSQKRPDMGKITIKTYHNSTHVVCEISDDGPGIPQKNIHKIFDPFFTTKEVGKGTGLGLSISYDIIVKKHKGILSIQSEPGKGATFIIELPIKSPANETQELQDE